MRFLGNIPLNFKNILAVRKTTKYERLRSTSMMDSDYVNDNLLKLWYVLLFSRSKQLSLSLCISVYSSKALSPNQFLISVKTFPPLTKLCVCLHLFFVYRR